MPSPFPIEFNFGADGDKVYRFDSAKEVRQWWNQERQFLDQLRHRNTRLEELEPWFTDTENLFRNTEEKLQQFETALAKTGSNLDAVAVDLVSWFTTQMFAKGRLPLSSSPRGLKAQEILKTRGPLAAQWALSVWFKGRGSVVAAQFGGAFDAIMFDKGFGTLDSERESLLKVREEWTTHLAKSRAEIEMEEAEIVAVRSRSEQIEDTISRQQEQHLRNVAAWEAAHKARLQEVTDAFQVEMAAISKQLVEHRAFHQKEVELHSSVAYWSALQAKHGRLANLFAALTLTGGIGLAFYLSRWVDWIRAATSDPKTPVIVFVGFVIGLIAWGLRLLVKLFLSSVHLRADAEERVTMLKTYLALAKNNEGIKDKDRTLMIQTVFRSATSLAKDDGGPIALELVRQAIGKDK
jgi:hypothetical protein